MALLLGGGDRAVAGWWARGRPAPLAPGHTALRVAVDASYPPFAAVEADGDLWGLEVDVARAIAARLDVPLALTNTDAGGALDALAARAFDAVLAGILYDPTLVRDVRFSRPYFDAGPVLLGRPDAPRAMPGFRVLVEAGSPWTTEARQLEAAGAAARRTWDLDAAVAAVRAGSVDAVLVDRATALELAAEGDLDLRATDDPRSGYGFRVALGRANRDLALAIDRALEELAGDGELARIERRWLGGRRGG